MQMQDTTGAILGLATAGGMDASGISAWVFDSTNDYPILRTVNIDGYFGTLLPPILSNILPQAIRVTNNSIELSLVNTACTSYQF